MTLNKNQNIYLFPCIYNNCGTISSPPVSTRTRGDRKPTLSLSQFLPLTEINQFSLSSSSETQVNYKILYQCVLCPKTFRTVNQLQDHWERKHRYENGRETNHIFDWNVLIVNGSYIEKKIANCHTEYLVFGHHQHDLECNHTRKLLNSCFLRICPKCLQMRKYRYLRLYESVVSKFKRTSLLTLTYKGYYGLNPIIKKNLEYCLRLFFKQLRYHCKNYDIQYIRVLEVNNKGDNQFFYHYHFLIDMPYVSQKSLSQSWEKLTGSYIVDIRYVGNRWKKNQKIGYICRYLAKPQKDIDYDKYALYVYRNHFVQSLLVTGSVVAQKSGNMTCPDCGQELSYLRNEEISHEIFHT